MLSADPVTPPASEIANNVKTAPVRMSPRIGAEASPLRLLLLVDAVDTFPSGPLKWQKA